MGTVIGSNFRLKTGLPLDSRAVKADLLERDAIPAIERFDGLEVYVVATQSKYQLQGGITNANWVMINAAGGILGMEKFSIQGYRDITVINTVNLGGNYIEVNYPGNELFVGDNVYFVGSTGNDGINLIVDSIINLGGGNKRLTFDPSSVLLSSVANGTLKIPSKDSVSTLLNTALGVEIQVWQGGEKINPDIKFIGSNVQFLFHSPNEGVLEAIIQGQA